MFGLKYKTKIPIYIILYYTDFTIYTFIVKSRHDY